MPPQKASFVFVLILSIATEAALGAEVGNADAAAASPPEEQKQACSIIGKMALPAETPDWFRGGELSFAGAVVLIEANYRGPRIAYPPNYRELPIEERRAWYQEYKETEAYREYRRAYLEAYFNRPQLKFPVSADGSFRVDGLKPDRYNIVALVPHAKAQGKEIAMQSWATAYKQIVLKEDGQSVNVGTMQLTLNNVVVPGDVAPSWVAEGYDGGKVKSSDFRGKHLLIDFWATWCGPCIEEFPHLEKACEEFGGDDLEIVGLSIDTTIDAPKEFLEKRPSPYRQGFIGEWGDEDHASRDFGVTSIPSIWLIGPDGKVIARDLRGEDLITTLGKALKREVDKE
ncbi:TlpA family protein disulfide reductase [Rubripirellula amarantea]|nr:TlpA family protein disulfide reductase [Rubripirellula amarantea]